MQQFILLAQIAQTECVTKLINVFLGRRSFYEKCNPYQNHICSGERADGGVCAQHHLGAVVCVSVCLVCFVKGKDMSAQKFVSAINGFTDRQRQAAELLIAGVVDPTPELKAVIVSFLTFMAPPTTAQIEKAAEVLATSAADYDAALIGGAPYLMSALERHLKGLDVKPLYSFTQRVSEEKMVDGSVVKTNVFKHVSFVEVD